METEMNKNAVTTQKVFVCTTFKLCDNNGYLTTQLSNFFAENGHDLVRNPEEAEWIVISTCGFDQERENEATRMINQYLDRFAQTTRIIICGCLSKINPDLFDGSLVTLIGAKDLSRFNVIFSAKKKIEEVSGNQLDDKFINREYGVLDAYYLQICQGCVNGCSYCAIKKAKGHVSSKSIEEVVRQMKQGVGLGFTRFMLLGDDCGSYGADIGVDLADLLNELNKYDVRLLLNYIEPGAFKRLYEKVDHSVFNKIDFINVPVQSVSKRIISLMNRKYETTEIMKIAMNLKARFPHLYLETHVIFAFPSETREEFRESFKLSEAFDAVIYFYYTDRKGVKSSALPGKIGPEELRCRVEEITRHPRFSWEHQSAEPPLVLLGYGPDTSDLFKSLDLNNIENKPEKVTAEFV